MNRTTTSKPRKAETHAAQKSYTNAAEIRETLRGKFQDTDLISLRNQLTVRANEGQLSTQDARVVLVRDWLNVSPGAHEVFDIWERSSQASIMALCASIIASLLNLVSSQFIYQSLGNPIMKTLLSLQWARRLNGHLGAANTDLVLSTLKLYNAMVGFAGGKEQRAVMDIFPWDLKSLPKLLYMRRKKKEDRTDMLSKPDIRTLYMLFLLSFLDERATTPVKLAFLERHREAFLGIFKGLHQDPYSVLQRVLEILWKSLWCDMKIKRSTKITMFGEATLAQLLKLYERTLGQDEDTSRIPADVAHYFLLAICTHPGTGVCFRDQGWYARDDSADEMLPRYEGAPQRTGKVYNKILANLLKSLKINEDSRQQELALKILAACPELVAGYWGRASLTLEPRLSSKWITNVAFFGSVISLPVPTSSFLLPSSTPSSSGNNPFYRPNPPTVTVLIENVLPSLNLKTLFTRGLQSAVRLVQHSSAIALVKCLLKLETVTNALQATSEQLEEDETGLWQTAIAGLQKEARKRVPDFQVVVAFSLQAQGNANQKLGLLGESAQRLLWLYHWCLPSIVTEARFDVGKLLNNFESTTLVGPQDDGGRLDQLQQLHTIRLLQENDQFVWSGKTAGSRSHFSVLLTLYLSTPVPAIRSTVTALLRRVLSDSILFQHDPHELDYWLASLPMTARAPGAAAPDGTPLSDEGKGLITLLDDCVQRCMKTPYRYIEDLQTFLATAKGDTASGTPEVSLLSTLTPLFMTLLEQLEAKSKKSGLLSASDALAAFTYIRKLTLAYLSKQDDEDQRLQQAVLARLQTLITDVVVCPTSPCIGDAITREVALLCVALDRLDHETTVSIPEPSKAVQAFLSKIEALPTPGDVLERRNSAYELVDWIRLVDQKLHPSETQRLLSSIARLHGPAGQEALYHLHHPKATWLNAQLAGHTRDGFDVFFLNCGKDELQNNVVRETLVEVVFLTEIPPERAIRRAFHLVMHRLSCMSRKDKEYSANHLSLLALIATKGKSLVNDAEWDVLRQEVFFSSSTIKGLCMSRHLTVELQSALSAYVHACVDANTPSAMLVTSGICTFWSQLVKSHPIADLQHSDWRQCQLWATFMRYEDSLSLLVSISTSQTDNSATVEHVANVILDSLRYKLVKSADSTSYSELLEHFPHLLTLRTRFPRLPHLWDVIYFTLIAYLPAGYDARESTDISVATVEARWTRRLQNLPFTSDLDFVLSEWKSVPAARIISTMLYKSKLFSMTVADWLRALRIGDIVQDDDVECLAGIVYAYLDSNRREPDLNFDWLPIFERIADTAFGRSTASALQVHCGKTLSIGFECLPGQFVKIAPALKLRLDNVKANAVTSGLLRVCGNLPLNSTLHKPLLHSISDLALQWAARRFSQSRKMSKQENAVLDIFTRLFTSLRAAKAHLVEPMLTSAIKEQIREPKSLQFSRTAAQFSGMKPVVVNRQIQSILQHDHFHALTEPGRAGSRKEIISLLHALFYSHPSNTCQSSHMQPLVRAYGGTFSFADCQLLSIFNLFEVERKLSSASMLRAWSASPGTESKNALEALLSLDPSRIFRTCLKFPLDRQLSSQIFGIDDHAVGSDIYDPNFIVLLFAHMLVESPPTSAMEWVELFRTNVVSLFIRCVASGDPALRDSALDQLSSLNKQLEKADMHEKPHVHYIMHLLKNVLTPATDDYPPRLPAYSTLLLAHALRGVFYPANFIYPLTARFLLQRPAFDVTDMPMLFGMLYSSSDDWKKERGWIVRFLADGFADGNDWVLFKRRHTWELLASMYQSSNDRTLRQPIMEVIAKITCNRRASTSLVLKSAFLSWAEMQACTVKADEVIGWMKILENLVVVLDSEKIESATDGEWRASLSRCLSTLLSKLVVGNHTLSVLVLMSRLLLRIALLRGTPQPNLSALLAQSVSVLQRCEAECYLPKFTPEDLQVALDSAPRLPSPPFSNYGLHELPELPGNDAWGQSVESLWQTCMAIDGETSIRGLHTSRSRSWDTLTCRLLVWRCRTDSEGVGEWARIQTITHLGDT